MVDRYKLTIILSMFIIITAIASFLLWQMTMADMLPVPLSLSKYSISCEQSLANSPITNKTGKQNNEITVHSPNISNFYRERLPLLFDRNNVPLNSKYNTLWNETDFISLHQIPVLLRQIFILSEDKNFYNHYGIDWIARLHAIIQNISARKAIRGASTITEQVIRMIHPRKRTVWSRWLEGFEAVELERHNSKADILEFYLNQVPYASNRRGLVQAARFYFDRALGTLSIKEMLALAALVRAPSSYDLYSHPGRIDKPVDILANRAISEKLITEAHWKKIKDIPFDLKSPELYVEAPHFVRHVYNTIEQSELILSAPVLLKTALSDLALSASALSDLALSASVLKYKKLFSTYFGHSSASHIRTTLDASLQNKAQSILRAALKNQKKNEVSDGAILIVKHDTGEILAWVVDSIHIKSQHHEQLKSQHHEQLKYTVKEQFIDAVKTLRQPGSAMKPFLYSLALEKGWNAATLINDAPLNEPVGLGIHTYHNYSNIHYGYVTLRNALGNSLNIPAVKTIRFTGVSEYLEKLKKFGIRSLNRHPDYYGDGLALGNGEVSLYEMVQAYSVLANAGKFIPLTCFYNDAVLTNTTGKENVSERLLASISEFDRSCYKSNTQSYLFSTSYLEQVISKEIASIISNILSDPGARELEFGGSDLLNFPVQTAVKTGTSTDYRDAWAMGYNRNYTAGVWMGNLNGSPTVELTGSRGPAFVLRSVFAELNRMAEQRATSNGGNRPLYMSPELEIKDVCVGKDKCIKKTEWFINVKKDNNKTANLENTVTVNLENSESKNEHYRNITDCDDIDDKLGERKGAKKRTFGFVNPFNGIQIAMDPRIPDDLEYLEFRVSGVLAGEKVNWVIDGKSIDSELSQKSYIKKNDSSKFRKDSINNSVLWNITRGYHNVYSELVDKTGSVIYKDSVNFWVK